MGTRTNMRVVNTAMDLEIPMEAAVVAIAIVIVIAMLVISVLGDTVLVVVAGGMALYIDDRVGVVENSGYC